MTALARPAASMVSAASFNIFGGKSIVCSWYILVLPGRAASIKRRISEIVWLWLNRATIRVPSESLSWIDVTGNDSSTIRPCEEPMFGLWTNIGSLSLVAEELPNVLPTPWKAACLVSNGGYHSKWINKKKWSLQIKILKKWINSHLKHLSYRKKHQNTHYLLGIYQASYGYLLQYQQVY